MAGGVNNDGGDPSGSTPASGAGAHPPKKKVELPGKSGAATSVDATSGKATPRRKTKRPIYKRGGFWFAVIVVEVIGALIISFAASKSADEVDLSGGDLAAFCVNVQAIRGQTAPPSVDLATAATEFQAQAAALRSLDATAPTSVRPDLETLAALTDELVATVKDAEAKKAADPSYSGGILDLGKKQADVVARSSDANHRLEAVVRAGCGIDLDPSRASTTPSTTR